MPEQSPEQCLGSKPKNVRKLLTTFHLANEMACFLQSIFNVQENKHFKTVNLLAFTFVRMVSSRFITNIRHFFCLCGKYRNYAEDADFRELCRSALPHPVSCHDVGSAFTMETFFLRILISV